MYSHSFPRERSLMNTVKHAEIIFFIPQKSEKLDHSECQSVWANTPSLIIFGLLKQLTGINKKKRLTLHSLYSFFIEPLISLTLHNENSNRFQIHLRIS